MWIHLIIISRLLLLLLMLRFVCVINWTKWSLCTWCIQVNGRNMVNAVVVAMYVSIMKKERNQSIILKDNTVMDEWDNDKGKFGWKGDTSSVDWYTPFFFLWRRWDQTKDYDDDDDLLFCWFTILAIVVKSEMQLTAWSVHSSFYLSFILLRIFAVSCLSFVPYFIFFVSYIPGFVT